MFLVAIAFLVGHCLVHSLAELPKPQPWAWILTSTIIALAIALLIARRRGAQRLTRHTTVALALALGFAWAWGNASLRLADRLPDSQLSATQAVDADIVGFVASTPGVTDEGVRFIFELRDSQRNLPSRVELTWYDTAERPAPGELWQLSVRLKPPRGFANPGSSDFEAQLFRNGIGATGYVRGNDRDVGANRRIATPTWRYPILRLRAHIASKLAAALADAPDLKPMLGIVQGLAVGETSLITSDQWRVFANTGTTHLIAISGSHIGMVAFLVAWIAGWLARRLPIQSRRIAVLDVQSLCGMSAAIVYAALAGFSVPTQRTLVMLLVYFGTRYLRREVGITQGLSLAMIGVLLIDPFAPLSPGFWLSFGAVAAIFLATSGRILRAPWYSEYFRLQAVVSIALLPFLIGAFGSVSVISPLVNLLAIPWFTFMIVPVVLVASFCLLLNDALGSVIVHVAAQLLKWSWPLMSRASELPLATWHLPQWPVWIAALLLVGCIVLIAPGMLVTRMTGAMLCMPAIFWTPQPLPLGSIELAMLDVGQGLSVVVRTRSHTLVYDTGPSFRSGRDTGQLVVLPYLYARDIRSIDTLMISHSDNDHIGGAASIVKSMPTRKITAGPSVDGATISTQPIEQCVDGQSWQWDDVSFNVIHPLPAKVSEDDAAIVDTKKRGKRRRAATPNDTSCVLRIVTAKGSVLLTGDIEKQTEARLVESNSLQRTDIVVVPHHGSRTSSTESFVAATSPRVALISAGFGNRWGFPKQDVVDHWRSVDAQILTSAESGAVEFSLGAAGISAPRAYRIEHRAYWRD